MAVPRTPADLDAWRLEARQAAESYLEGRQFSRGQGDSWLGTLDVPVGADRSAVQVVVGLPNRFPDVVPTVAVLDPAIPKPIAHMEGEGRLCLIQPHSARLDTRRPADIVRDVLDRAATILADALTGRSERELVDEFLAYWGRGVSEPAIISLATTSGKTNVAHPVVLFQVRLGEKGKAERYISDSLSQMKEWASRRGANFEKKDQPAFLLPLERPVRPPDFDAPPSVGSWIATLRGAAAPEVWHVFEEWLARVELPVVIVQSIPSQSSPIPSVALLELERANPDHRRRLREVKNQRRHRSAGGTSIDAALELPATADQPIQRRISARLDADYLTRRGGASSLVDKRVVLVGCGAVGSHVATQLAAAGVGALHFVDPETLQPENAHRHVCGLFFWGTNKAHALTLWLARTYPHQSVEAHASDFETLWRDVPDVLADADLLVFATGDETLERRATAIMASKPRIHAWVEPMGIGGHAIAVVPRGDGFAAGCYECLFKENGDGLMCNAASLAAPNQQFARTLAGCAGFHTPFSALDAQRSAIEASSLAVAILLGEVTASRLLTWRGPTRTFLEAGFTLSPRGQMTGCAREEIDADGFADSACEVCRLTHEAHATPHESAVAARLANVEAPVQAT